MQVQGNTSPQVLQPDYYLQIQHSPESHEKAKENLDPRPEVYC